MTGNIIFNFIVSWWAKEQGSIHQRKLFKHWQCPVAQRTVYNVPVAGAKSSKNKLPQVLPLAHLGVIFHSHMESIQFMPGDVSEKLRQVEPSQKLHGGVEVSRSMCLQTGCPVIEVRVPEHAPTGHALLVRLQVNGVLQEFSQVPRGTGAAEVGGGKNRVAGGWGLAGRDARGANRVAPAYDTLLLRVLPVHRVPSLDVVT